MKPHYSFSSCFFYFLLFNLCFLCFQEGLLYSQNCSFISAVKLPKKIWLELAATLGVHIVIYILLSLLQTFLLLGILKRPWHYFSPERWQIIIWTLCVCAILCANTYYFPLSVFSKLFSPPIPEQLIVILLGVSLFILSVLFINSLLFRQSIFLLMAIIPVVLIFTLPNPHLKTMPIQQQMHNRKPNIIILGIDSLSPESINSENMPFLAKLLDNSIQFTNTISTLARTYPSWSSILTGLYPEHHHGEENLFPKQLVKSNESIVWVTKIQGYNTIFATDDRRFNSIDKEFGFNKIIGPKLGVSDFLLGSFNDFPLSNLLLNCRISSWLFPYNYSNRASFFSYYPQTFNNTLQHELALQAKNEPLFLAVHFTLPHWPYAWAASSPEQVNNEFSVEKRNVLYQQSLKRINKQFQSFFNYLQQQDYLQNSLLIVLSDHGEVLYYPNSRLTNYHNYQGTQPSRFAEYLKNNTGTVLNKSAGHGSDLLSPRQYHSVLAFKIFQNGQQITQNNKISRRVALMDIAPTILAFLNLSKQQSMDGISLLQSIQNPQQDLPERTFFIESGMFPNQLLSKEQSIEIGAKFYQVNPDNGELEIKSDKLDYFNEQKLYGIIRGNWILALYPDKKTYIPVIQNLTSGLWIDDLQSDFAKITPADQLYQELRQFYGKKLFRPG